MTFEGIDGAGKSTHIPWLHERLCARGLQVIQTREPGGTELAEAIREWVLHRTMSMRTEALLVFAARQDHLDRVIRPALEAGTWVLCDRFTDATFAYQGGGRGFDWNVLKNLEQMVQKVPATQLRQPDLTIWFDLPPAVAAERLSTARLPDKFESQPQSFFQAVRDGYAKRMQEAPTRFAQIAANQSREAVWVDVLMAIETAYAK
jgi:dTMP kinase